MLALASQPCATGGSFGGPERNGGRRTPAVFRPCKWPSAAYTDSLLCCRRDPHACRQLNDEGASKRTTAAPGRWRTEGTAIGPACHPAHHHQSVRSRSAEAADHRPAPRAAATPGSSASAAWHAHLKRATLCEKNDAAFLYVCYRRAASISSMILSWGDSPAEGNNER